MCSSFSKEIKNVFFRILSEVKDDPDIKTSNHEKPRKEKKERDSTAEEEEEEEYLWGRWGWCIRVLLFLTSSHERTQISSFFGEFKEESLCRIQRCKTEDMLWLLATLPTMMSPFPFLLLWLPLVSRSSFLLNQTHGPRIRVLQVGSSARRKLGLTMGSSPCISKP